VAATFVDKEFRKKILIKAADQMFDLLVYWIVVPLFQFAWYGGLVLPLIRLIRYQYQLNFL
jgi:hypothetical protein